MKSLFHTLLILGAILACSQVLGAGVGDELPAFSLKDQWDVARTLDDTALRIYTTADRKGDSAMKSAMVAFNRSNLDAQKAIVVADISAAPGFVKRIIRSSLKDRGYPTWLDITGTTREFLPYRPDHVTIIELNRRRITMIRHVADAEILKQEILATASDNAARIDQK